MGNVAEARVLRVVDPFEEVAGIEAAPDVRQTDPGAVQGEVGEGLVKVELAVATKGIGEETGKVLEQWKDGDSDDYANEVGFTD